MHVVCQLILVSCGLGGPGCDTTGTGERRQMVQTGFCDCTRQRVSHPSYLSFVKFGFGGDASCFFHGEFRSELGNNRIFIFFGTHLVNTSN